MTDPTCLNEYNLSEKPTIDLLERLGYTYIPGANLAEEASLREFKRALMQNLLSGQVRIL